MRLLFNRATRLAILRPRSTFPASPNRSCNDEQMFSLGPLFTDDCSELSVFHSQLADPVAQQPGMSIANIAEQLMRHLPGGQLTSQAAVS
ncbi:hypothetical protein T10_10451 [Trichinella papuae]|uniref:Uncharacterized protein n=1 Tax=Trichinella papuae TaxID=268474 RepID=A0A0V1MW32_9BILA|nr:hypothetical protein T10_10451 [Trichinella papuae]